MMKMMLTQRGFELVVKALHSGDAMLKIASDVCKNKIPNGDRGLSIPDSGYSL